MKYFSTILLFCFAVLNIEAQNWQELPKPTNENINSVCWYEDEIFVSTQNQGFLFEKNTWSEKFHYENIVIEKSCYNQRDQALVLAGQMNPIFSTNSLGAWASINSLSGFKTVDLFNINQYIVLLATDSPVSTIFKWGDIDTLLMLSEHLPQLGFALEDRIFVIFNKGDDNILYSTNNQGQSWDYLTNLGSGQAIDALSYNSKIAVAFNYEEEAKIFVSENQKDFYLYKSFANTQICKLGVDADNEELAVAGNIVDQGFYYDSDFHYFPEKINDMDVSGDKVVLGGDNGSIYMSSDLIFEPSSIKLFETLEINFYPIPTQDYLNIDVLDEKNSVVKVYSLVGKLIKKENFRNKISLDLSTLSTGVYFLEVTQEGKRTTKKFLKK